MNKLPDEFLKEAASAFLYFVPSLRDEIESQIPEGTSLEERRSIQEQKAWAGICSSAQRAGLEPVDFAKHLVQLRKLERRRTGT
ncbi:hypothetical protein ACNFIA_28795 [Pseudomonas sp. NY15437]|uniref:hypothetical protein n=1 Tax=Pseudomonas sp. NY15437 TaxID=3400360 RepID=UPI003A864549